MVNHYNSNRDRCAYCGTTLGTGDHDICISCKYKYSNASRVKRVDLVPKADLEKLQAKLELFKQQMEDLPDEIMKLVNKHFWELL